MPQLELGDLEASRKYKEFNIPQLKRLIDAGYDIVAPIPSCVLMFKQELPLMFPEDADVQAVRGHIFDPFEYLMLRHKAGLLSTDFKAPLGKVSYHVPCHLRVQNIGLKTRDVLKLDAGHDGRCHRALLRSQWHVRREEGVPGGSVKIGRPVMQRVESAKPDIIRATARWPAIRSKAA